MDRILTTTNTPGESGPGSNGNEGVLITPKSPELEQSDAFSVCVGGGRF